MEHGSPLLACRHRRNRTRALERDLKVLKGNASPVQTRRAAVCPYAILPQGNIKRYALSLANAASNCHMGLIGKQYSKPQIVDMLPPTLDCQE